MSVRQDFTIEAGRDFALTVALTGTDGTTRLDLTGCTLAWAVSRAAGLTPLISKSSDDATEIEVTSAADGEAIIHLVPEDTLDLGGLTCHHEMAVMDASDEEATVFRGLVTIRKSVI